MDICGDRDSSCVLSHQHLAFTIRDVVLNSRRAGLVVQPEDYWRSSAASHRLASRSQHSSRPRFFRTCWGAEIWAEIHRTVGDADQTAAPRKCTYSGRRFGEGSFIAEMEERLQRKMAAMEEWIG